MVLSSQDIKALALGFAGVAGGFTLALIAACAWELVQPGLRTPVEAGISTATLPILSYVVCDPDKPSPAYQLIYKTKETASNERALRAFWLTQTVGSSGKGRRKSFLFVATQVRQEEDVFWVALLDIIKAEKRKVIFCNLDDKNEVDFHLVKRHDTVTSYVESIEDLPEGYENETLLVRLNRVPTSEEVEIFGHMDAFFMMNSPTIAEREETRHVSELMRQLIGPSDGLLLLDSTSGKLLYRFINGLEMTVLNNYFGKGGVLAPE